MKDLKIKKKFIIIKEIFHGMNKISNYYLLNKKMIKKLVSLLFSFKNYFYIKKSFNRVIRNLLGW